MVFVSEYCVVHRERFVKNCHGDVSEEEIPFCKSYPSACTSTAGVIPVLTYCQRYYKHYPKFCAGPKIEQEMLQFCFAFEQFCLPELTPAKSEKQPQSSLRRCEDVLPEARRVCNPFPHPRDTFNVLRCSNFLTHCKKFVDWA
uniref:FZ domain-containing protein n=1 Tax=Angiostrongylus cantonensis TaxID=6313 RepID=A0A158P9V7_ANGCA